jgi:hypothetical protein
MNCPLKGQIHYSSLRQSMSFKTTKFACVSIFIK